MNFVIKPSEIEALSQLARAPSTLAAIETAHAKSVADRTAHAARIAELDSKSAIDWPRGRAAIAKAIEARDQAIRDLANANAKLAKANADAFNASTEYTRGRQAAEAALLASADLPTISAWKDELLAELNALGKSSVIVTNVVTTRAELTGKPIRTGVSNMSSIVSRMAAVRAAYHAADLLKLEPDQRRLPSIIAEIRSSFTKVDNNPSQPTKV